MDIVRIRLRKPKRVLPFLCEGLALQRDDTCIVESEHGLEWGVCLLPPDPCPPEAAKRVTMRVLRKATDADLDALRVIMDDEERARQLCCRHIEQRNLPMQLVDVEYGFDRHKITFYFTAENRVDFRELVRDLARELHSRIELRHIQVRDRSRLVGGLGCCGRMLCCASWLEEFVPISMRMAKCQNLSLNPGKISGQCGRLLCCLQYECEGYERGDVPVRKPPAVPESFGAISPDPAVAERGFTPSPVVVEAPAQSRNASTDAQKNAKQKFAPKGKAKKKKRKKKPGKGGAA